MKSLNHLRRVVAWKQRVCRAAILALTTLLVCPSVHAAEKIEVFRTGDELIVRLDRFDLLRQTHSGVNAALQLRRAGNDKQLLIDLADAAIQGTLVVDLANFGKCDAVTVTVKDGAGRIIAAQTVAPIPDITVQSFLSPSPAGQPAPTGPYAYIEPGTEMRKALGGTGRAPAPPRILLPDITKLRQLKLASPVRMVSKQDITYPVASDIDFPVTKSSLVARQTDFPDDPAKASIYFCYKKAIYAGQKLERWQKFLVEVPIQSSWGEKQGDEDILLTPDQFKVHVTNELSPPIWNGTRSNILGDGDSDLGQTGDCCEDDRGRIYWRTGRYLVRFDPHTGKFEQSPTFDFGKLVPAGAGMINDALARLIAMRGRIFYTLCNDTWNGNPGGGINRRVGGVFSISQDWRDPEAFRADIRLHVGSWESARPTLYGTAPKPNTDVRKLGGTFATEAGLFIVTAGTKYEGGPWRLDLDAKGNNKFFGVVKSLDATVAADGTRLAPTRLITIKGLPQGVLNPGGGGGRDYIGYSTCGEITIPRASVRLMVLGTEGLKITKVGKHGVSTYPGAPQGTLTVRYDLVRKVKSTPEAQGPLAASLTGGPSLGPAFLITPIPGEADRALAVCEYTGYVLSILDFSTIGAGKSVTKHPLSAAVGLGPYNSLWLRHADEQWLYINGYIGMTRLKYAKAGKPVDEMASSPYTTSPQAIDGRGRGPLKHVDGLMPVFGGRLINTGSGAVGRGGTPFSTGPELLDTKALGQENVAPSQTAAYMSRCFSLEVLQSRMVWRADDGSRRQEVFAAGGNVNRAFLNELSAQDKALAPTNLDAKIFLYQVDETRGLSDLYGFSTPPSGKGKSAGGQIALSPCHRFLVIMSYDGVLYTYSIANRQFIDGLVVTKPSGDPIVPMEFKRPSETIFTSPDGQLFFLAGPADKDAASIQFNRIVVDGQGRLSVEPYLGITCASNADCTDFGGIVRCFLPDLKNKDGSYDLILGHSQRTVLPSVRVVSDFIPPAKAR